MSTPINMPVAGRVVKIHRMPGHYVGKGDPIVDVQVDEIFRVSVCAPFAGKIMRCRDLGTAVKAGDRITELTGVGKPTWELFIAYRRADAPGHAGRIGERLINYFGPGQVFKDIEALPLGVDFIDFIREKLLQAFVMVVVIGPEWIQDRLHDPHDLHREEIRTALERGLHIVPALVNGAAMPKKQELPKDIQPLVRRNAVEITDTRWDYDAGRLVENIELALAQSLRRKRFLAQVPSWDHEGWQWIQDEPPSDKLRPR